MYPVALIALGVALYYAIAAWKQPRPAVIVAVILWLLYAVYEVLIAQAILCDEKCNIRVDLLLIWPILWVSSFFASKPPGKWSPRTWIFGVISIGSLSLALIMLVLMYLESKDLFFPERKACKSGGTDAIVACDQALVSAPGDYTLYYHRALAYRAKGEMDRALADMSKTIEAYPHFTDAFVGRGVVYQEKGDLERALADFNSAIKVRPEDAVALYRRGLALAAKGELEPALADLSTAINIDSSHLMDTSHRLAPAEGDLFDGRGLVHLRLGNFKKAIADYDEALKLDPKLARALYGRGLAKSKSGDKAGGDTDITAAKAANAGIAEAFAKFGLNESN